MPKPIDARALVRRPLLMPSPLQPYMTGSFRTETHDGLVLSALGGRDVSENYVFVFAAEEPERVLAMARAFFGCGGFSIVVESETNDTLVDFLESEGWSLDEDEPAMLLYPIPDLPPISSVLHIRRVTTQQEFEDFMRISETGRRWVPSLEAATNPNVCLLVGYRDGDPVATSRINCLGDAGEINGVVTDPRFRRRGFGTEMTWAAVAEGVRHGCDAIVLTATEMGYPVYLRMGFVPVCSYRTYVPSESDVNTTSADPARARTGNSG